MPLGCPIQDGYNNDCQEDDRGVKRGLKSLCEAKLSSKWTLRLCVKKVLWIREEFKGARQKTRVLQWHHMTYTDRTVYEVDEVEDAVRRELEGLGKLLG